MSAALALCSACSEGAYFPDASVDAVPDAAPAVRLPRDEGVHDVPLEWWYYTGHLVTEAGREFGFQVTFFRRSAGVDLFLGNFAITDFENREFSYAERAWFDAAAETGYALDVAGWRASGTMGHDTVSASAGGNTVELSFTPIKPVVLHGGDGTVGSGMDATQYYSWTRLSVTGTVAVAGQEHQVTGQAWMDHQWFARDVALGELEWDWLSLQLDDGVDVMLALLRDDKAELVGGTWVDAEGNAEELAFGDFTVEVLGEWTNPISGNTYPMGWKVRLPERDLVLEVQPVLQNQELHGLRDTPLDYWEGAVTVTGQKNGAAISGRGYVELTGYATAAQ